MRPRKLEFAINLNHRQSAASGCDGVAFSCVRFLADPQFVQLALEGIAIDYSRRCFFHGILHRSLLCGTGFG
jgi:hypothetical protein